MKIWAYSNDTNVAISEQNVLWTLNRDFFNTIDPSPTPAA